MTVSAMYGWAIVLVLWGAVTAWLTWLADRDYTGRNVWTSLALVLLLELAAAALFAGALLAIGLIFWGE